MLPEGEGDTDGPGRPKKPFGDGFGPAGASPPAASRPHPLTPVPNTEAGRASVRLRASPSAEPEKTLAASDYTPQPGWGVDGDPGADLAHNAAPAPRASQRGSDRPARPGPLGGDKVPPGPGTREPRGSGSLRGLPAFPLELPGRSEAGSPVGMRQARRPAGSLRERKLR